MHNPTTHDRKPANHTRIEAILQRLEQRRRSTTLPPDFAHGNVRLDAAYDAFGAAWLDNAIFVVESADGCAVAKFDDYFLTVTTYEAGEAWSLEAEMAVVLTINPECASQVEYDGRVIPIGCDEVRFRELERELLGVSRERDCLQTDALSLVAICSTLCAD